MPSRSTLGFLSDMLTQKSPIISYKKGFSIVFRCIESHWVAFCLTFGDLQGICLLLMKESDNDFSTFSECILQPTFCYSPT